MIWLATALVLLVWWNGLVDAARTRGQNSPYYIRSEQQAIRDFDRMTPLTFMQLLESSRVMAFNEAYGQEHTKRLLGTVVVLAAFVVWFIGRRK